MAQVLKFGQMVPNMKVNGATIKPMAKVNSGMQMGMSMRETGKMTRLTASESIFMLTEPNMKVTGKTTYKMAGVLKVGQMAVDTREDTRKE